MFNSLITYLKYVRSTVLQVTAKQRSLTKSDWTLVIGNTSADLDSCISAISFAYFHTNKAQQQGDSKRLFVPIINLNAVPSSDLWRLRPELGVALRLSILGRHEGSNAEYDEQHKSLLSQLVTVADIQSTSDSPLHQIFTGYAGPRTSGVTSTTEETKNQAIVLLDHNALAISPLPTEFLRCHFSAVGVIDHHKDESTIPLSASPRVIQTGIGSCSSLVVKHFRDERLWPEKYAASSSELAKIMLSPILIDTENLTAGGDRNSDTDSDAVKFLCSQILQHDASWDRDAFYNEILQAKEHSLDRLTMPEIYERDYKEWTETSRSSSEPLTIGIASLVRDISWLTMHSGGTAADLVASQRAFALPTADDGVPPRSKLALFVLLASGNGPQGDFRKELAGVAFGTVAKKALARFEQVASDELGLREWHEDEALLNEMHTALRDVDGVAKIWWQGNVEKTRKHVAPLLRDAVKNA